MDHDPSRYLSFSSLLLAGLVEVDEADGTGESRKRVRRERAIASIGSGEGAMFVVFVQW